jgi:hypothetical protein
MLVLTCVVDFSWRGFKFFGSALICGDDFGCDWMGGMGLSRLLELLNVAWVGRGEVVVTRLLSSSCLRRLGSILPLLGRAMLVACGLGGSF